MILYATNWFRDYLTDSVEVVLQQYGLTTREVQVASAVVQGMSNQEIADVMCISTNTVKEHFKNIFRKMQRFRMIRFMHQNSLRIMIYSNIDQHTQRHLNSYACPAAPGKTVYYHASSC